MIPMEPPPIGLTLQHFHVERRGNSRIKNPFPAWVQGVDVGGECFDAQTVLDNLSSCGLYVRLLQRVEPGADLTITIKFTGDLTNDHSSPGVIAVGEVVRSEPQAGGVCGVAVKFKRREFLYAG
jgi:hypothetical protein